MKSIHEIARSLLRQFERWTPDFPKGQITPFVAIIYVDPTNRMHAVYSYDPVGKNGELGDSLKTKIKTIIGAEEPEKVISIEKDHL